MNRNQRETSANEEAHGMIKFGTEVPDGIDINAMENPGPTIGSLAGGFGSRLNGDLNSKFDNSAQNRLQKPMHIYAGHNHTSYQLQNSLGVPQGHGPHHLTVERKFLLAATSGTVIGLILMVVAVTTDYWLIVTNHPRGSHLSHENLLRISSHSGIWRICMVDLYNDTGTGRYGTDTRCRRHMLFPSEVEALRNHHEFDATSLDYTRTEVAFSSISLLLMFIGQGFAFYSFKERRYMFKRLTAFLHFLSAICVLICIEVLVSAVAYARTNLPVRHPAFAISTYGFSFVLAWVTCGTYFLAGSVFLFFSRKRKAPKIPTAMNHLREEDLDQAEADTPVALGR